MFAIAQLSCIIEQSVYRLKSARYQRQFSIVQLFTALPPRMRCSVLPYFCFSVLKCWFFL